VDEPAEPAVLPAEPEGVDPTVLPLLALPVEGALLAALEPVDLSLMVLVLTSQHLFGSSMPDPVPVCCAVAKPTPAMVATTARAAIFFMERLPVIGRLHCRRPLSRTDLRTFLHAPGN
jgi:hypothetical protein